MLKKSRPGIIQRRKPKIRFPSCSQNQGLESLSLILIARPRAPQSVFQQPDRLTGILQNIIVVESEHRTI